MSGMDWLARRRLAAEMVFAGIGSPGTNIPDLIGGLDADALAIINAMAVRPVAARQTAINALVTALKTNSVWTPLSVLYVFAAHTGQASLLNWKDPTGTAALATNSPTFTADRGWSGDGVAAFIDTQQVWSSLAGIGQDNAHLGAYAAYGGSNAGGIVGLGGAGGVSVGRSTGLFSSRLNNATATTADAVPATAGTHLCAARSVSTQHERYVDGAAVSAAVQTSTALPTVNLTGLRSNALYSPSAASLRALHAGPNISATDVSNIRNALQTYMAAVGAS